MVGECRDQSTNRARALRWGCPEFDRVLGIPTSRGEHPAIRGKGKRKYQGGVPEECID